jgi:glycosyltransferase involved in cell wall biosynthesis
VEALRSPRVAMLVRNPYTHDTRVEKEAATLNAAGYGVTIVAEAAAGLPAREERDGITVIRLSRPLARIPGLRFLASEFRAWFALMRTSPDILHAHDSNALLAVWLASWRLHKPFVYDAHDLWLGRPRRQRSRVYFWLNQAWYALLERILIPRAAGWITVSNPIARYLERRYRISEVVLVENFPDAALARDEATLPLRSLPGAESIAPGAPLVLYIGALMGQRGIEGLVDAMVEVPQAHLVLLGDGQLAGGLLDRATRLGIGSRVHRLGPVPGGDVVAYARSADIGVSPIVPSCLNYRFSLPNKLFQCMAAGLPIVASDFPQVREVVAASGAGLVVDTESPAAMAAAIRELLADPQSLRMRGAAGRRAVAENFNWGEASARLLALYDAAVHGRPPLAPDPIPASALLE